MLPSQCIVNSIKTNNAAPSLLVSKQHTLDQDKAATPHHVGPHVGDEVLQRLDAHGAEVHRHHRTHAQEELLNLPQGLAFLPVKNTGVKLNTDGRGCVNKYLG